MVVGGGVLRSIGESGWWLLVFIAGLFYIVVIWFGFFGLSNDFSQPWLMGWVSVRR